MCCTSSAENPSRMPRKVEGEQECRGERRERVPDERYPFLEITSFREHDFASRVRKDKHKGQRNERHDHGETGGLAPLRVVFVPLEGFRHGHVDAACNVIAEEDAAYGRGGYAGDDAEEDDPAEVCADDRRDGHRSRGGGDTGMRDGHARYEGDAVVE